MNLEIIHSIIEELPIQIDVVGDMNSCSINALSTQELRILGVDNVSYLDFTVDCYCSLDATQEYDGTKASEELIEELTVVCDTLGLTIRPGIVSE